jgi:hypothetical protein
MFAIVSALASPASPDLSIRLGSVSAVGHIWVWVWVLALSYKASLRLPQQRCVDINVFEYERVQLDHTLTGR